MADKSFVTRTWLPDLITGAALAAAPFTLPYLGFVPDTMSRILVFGLFGIGFDLLFGYTGLLSFGQAAFFGTGGFVSAYLFTAMGFSNAVFVLLTGMVAAAAAGVLVGLIALRRTGIYFAMITVAIAEVFFFLENSPLSDYTGGENGLPGRAGTGFPFGNYHDQGGKHLVYLCIYGRLLHDWCHDRAAHRAIARRAHLRCDPRQSHAGGRDSATISIATSFSYSLSLPLMRGSPAACWGFFRGTCRPMLSPSIRLGRSSFRP